MGLLPADAALIPQINKLAFTCHYCGKYVNERFRVQTQEGAYTLSCHPYCLLTRG